MANDKAKKQTKEEKKSNSRSLRSRKEEEIEESKEEAKSPANQSKGKSQSEEEELTERTVLEDRSTLTSSKAHTNGPSPAKDGYTQSLNITEAQTSITPPQLSDCAICLDDITVDLEIKLNTCNHNFCKPCIVKWLKDVENVCPLCKKRVTSYSTRDMLGIEVITEVKERK